MVAAEWNPISEEAKEVGIQGAGGETICFQILKGEKRMGGEVSVGREKKVRALIRGL